MKKMFVLLAMFCLCFQTIAVYAATPDFSGVWELNASKSTLPDTMAIESMTMTVSQTEKELQVESVAKMNPNQARGRILRVNGGPQTAIYSLEGKETLAEIGSGMTGGKETRKAAVTADGKLNLNVTRNFKNEMGDVTMKTNEIWELLDAGKTLKVTRYMETPRGATNAQMYFTKKSSGALMIEEDSSVPVDTRLSPPNEAIVPGEISANDKAKIPKKISGGVLNGKATSLPKPEYPAAARAVNASGAVNVQVTIDEQGDVISASAVSGHPLLRQAAEEAARNAKFAPTSLSGVPVKVTGVLVYNFTP